ncbi:class I SAM-dependent methyltransferase [Paenibacillus psychroresistens]|uniref:Class I SAM-dependent methyltransferase n=1 Tax=Paenibacillus psychroresistens TaxID=1778678 RepID=A0A6B8RJY6_9BACL|nr:class I SAM-dependent methyltransferase [Paenibacillus psychroresistens]QGQ96600.1 class I SAM-dependent methyltransferase [Paenibacillus psychroresistens]
MSYLKMLSQFGASSAHPGGFSATLEQLQHFNISKESNILEVGCGTGRTSCFLSKNGYQITAIDIDTDMLKKAKKRAEAQELNINFVEADVCCLPFKDNQFDVILAESVTNFADYHTALSEYYRVLKSGGTLYDREIVEVIPIPSDLRPPLFDFFAFRQLASLDQWKSLLNSIKYNHVSSWDYSLLVLDNRDQVNHPDEFQYPDSHIFTNFQALQTSFEYIDFINTYKEYLGSVVLIGSKP